MYLEQRDDDLYILDKEMMKKLYDYSTQLSYIIEKECEDTDEIDEDVIFYKKINETLTLIEQNTDID